MMRMALQMQQMGMIPPPGTPLPALGGAPGAGGAAPGLDFSALLGAMGAWVNHHRYKMDEYRYMDGWMDHKG